MASAQSQPPPERSTEEKKQLIEALIQALAENTASPEAQLPRLTKEQAFELTKLQFEHQQKERRESRIFVVTIVLASLVAFCVLTGMMLAYGQTGVLLELVKVVGAGGRGAHWLCLCKIQNQGQVGISPITAFPLHPAAGSLG